MSGGTLVQEELPLPLELWLLICHYARREDVVTLARVSKMLLSASRMELYREVVLKKHSSMNTLALLADPSFSPSRTITSITFKRLDTVKYTDVPFHHMPNLSSLSMLYCPKFISKARDQLGFLETLKEMCPRIKEIKLKLRGNLPDSDFQLHNLSHITWKEHREHSISPKYALR